MDVKLSLFVRIGYLNENLMPLTQVSSLRLDKFTIVHLITRWTHHKLPYI